MILDVPNGEIDVVSSSAQGRVEVHVLDTKQTHLTARVDARHLSKALTRHATLRPPPFCFRFAVDCKRSKHARYCCRSFMMVRKTFVLAAGVRLAHAFFFDVPVVGPHMANANPLGNLGVRKLHGVRAAGYPGEGFEKEKSCMGNALSSDSLLTPLPLPDFDGLRRGEKSAQASRRAGAA